MGRKKQPQGFDWRAFTPEDSPKTPIDVFEDETHQRLTTPDHAEGDTAFDFKRPVYDFSTGREVATGKEFELSTAASEKPVALIFGSYT
jgi:hypothetical protein